MYQQELYNIIPENKSSEDATNYAVMEDYSQMTEETTQFPTPGIEQASEPTIETTNEAQILPENIFEIFRKNSEFLNNFEQQNSALQKAVEPVSSTSELQLPVPEKSIDMAEELKRCPVSMDELKLKPKQSKAPRKFVPEELKDERYYAFRRKNTAASRRSREVAYEKDKRLKLRLAFLEEEDQRLRSENNFLRKVIADKDSELAAINLQ